MSSESVDAFVRLLGQNQRRIFLYVMSLVPNWNDAEEIIQETNLVLWREFARFELGTNFTAWACKVALHQVLAWRKRVKRNRLEFSPAFLEAVADEASAAAEDLEERSQCLARCIERLPAERRQMLRMRYSDGLAIEAIARQLERTEEAVYRALEPDPPGTSRLRHALAAAGGSIMNGSMGWIERAVPPLRGRRRGAADARATRPAGAARARAPRGAPVLRRVHAPAREPALVGGGAGLPCAGGSGLGTAISGAHKRPDRPPGCRGDACATPSASQRRPPCSFWGSGWACVPGVAHASRRPRSRAWPR